METTSTIESRHDDSGDVAADGTELAPAAIPGAAAPSTGRDGPPDGLDSSPGAPLDSDRGTGRLARTGAALHRLLPHPRRKTATGRVVDVGWLITDDKSSLVWDEPRMYARDDPAVQHAKAVNRCPSVLDYESRIVEVPCPFDLHLRIGIKDGKTVLVNRAGAQSAMRQSLIARSVVILQRTQWRHPNRPVLQIGTPYVFVSDDPVYINQLPPFNHYRKDPWPGVVIGGRFPIEVWPRNLSWAFEWHDMGKDLILRRGEPWFYARFETLDPARKPRLIEAARTPELQAYMAGISGVTNYVQRTYSLFSIARKRRPKKLLVKRSH